MHMLDDVTTLAAPGSWIGLDVMNSEMLTSQWTRLVIETIEKAFRLLAPIGLPLCYHPVVFSGERTALGLVSPSDRVMQAGDPVFAALGYWGSNNARAGFLVEGAEMLPTYLGG